MQIFVNKAPQTVEKGISLLKLLQKLNIYADAGIAIAVNNEVVTRSLWENRSIQENDKVIVITATQGG